MESAIADEGVNLLTGARRPRVATVPRLLAEMTMADLDQSSGDWAYAVRLSDCPTVRLSDCPTARQERVGGGLLTVAPGQLAIAAFSPRLDPTGTSVRAQLAVTQIAREPHLNLYLAKQHSSPSRSQP
jgi:glutaminase